MLEMTQNISFLLMKLNDNVKNITILYMHLKDFCVYNSENLQTTINNLPEQ